MKKQRKYRRQKTEVQETEVQEIDEETKEVQETQETDMEKIISVHYWKHTKTFRALKNKETQIKYYQRMNSCDEVLQLVGLDSNHLYVDQFYHLLKSL